VVASPSKKSKCSQDSSKKKNVEVVDFFESSENGEPKLPEHWTSFSEQFPKVTFQTKPIAASEAENFKEGYAVIKVNGEGEKFSLGSDKETRSALHNAIAEALRPDHDLVAKVISTLTTK